MRTKFYGLNGIEMVFSLSSVSILGDPTLVSTDEASYTIKSFSDKCLNHIIANTNKIGYSSVELT